MGEQGHLVTMLLIVVPVIIALILAYLFARAGRIRRHRAEFRAALSRNRDDYAKAYAIAHNKLSERWNVIEIIHDLSPYSLGPAGLPSEITFEQAFEYVRQIRASHNEPVAIVLHTMGGFSFPADMIAKALTEHKGRKVAFVPYTAMSGGTLIALATEEIFMGAAAALGPIDTQYWGLPLSAYQYLKAVKNVDRIEDEYLIRLHLAEKFEQSALERAKNRINAKHARSVADELTKGDRFHGDPISAEEAKNLGINVSQKDFPKDAYVVVDAKLKMLAFDLEQLARNQLEMKSAQRAEKTQRWWG